MAIEILHLYLTPDQEWIKKGPSPPPAVWGKIYPYFPAYSKRQMLQKLDVLLNMCQCMYDLSINVAFFLFSYLNVLLQDLREECLKLKTRVFDLEQQNRTLSVLFQQRMKPASGLLFQVSSQTNLYNQNMYNVYSLKLNNI